MGTNKSVQITLIIIVGIIVLALIGILFFKHSSSQNTLEVNGQSIIKATPDLITIYYNIETRGNTSKSAEDAGSKILNEMIIQIKKTGLKETDLKTQSFSIYPEYDWKNNKQEIIGYVASYSLKIEVSINETEKIGDLIDAGTNSGAGISYINFELSNELEQKYKAEAIKTASEDARIKAEAIAQGFNKNVGKLVSVSLNEYYYYPYKMYDSMMGGDVMEAKESITTITPSDQEISAYVTAVYKLK